MAKSLKKKKMDSLIITKKDDYAICQINNGKVNAVDLQLSKDLDQFYKEAAADDSISGVILAGRPNCFSAGLDVMKLAMGGKDYAYEFWKVNLESLQTMVNFSKPVIGALTGYAPAAGTILALTTDYRIMARGEKHVMGMHEIKLSMLIPEMYFIIYHHWLGDHKTSDLVFNAKLMQADDAVKNGLAHEACEVDEVLPKAEAMMQKWCKSYNRTFRRTKDYLRKDLRSKINDVHIDVMVDEIVDFAFDPESLKRFGEFAMSLKK